MDPSRVVRLRTPPKGGGPPFRFGSDYLIGPGKVLTAAHTLRPPGDDALPPQVGDRCQVLPWHGDAEHGWLDSQVESCESLPDLAVVSVPGLDQPVTPVRWGRLDEGSEPLRWEAIGFPVAGLSDSGREPESAWGDVSPATEAFGGRLGLVIRSRDAQVTERGTSGWAGLSGAAIFCRDRLVGVVIEDPEGLTASLTGLWGARTVSYALTCGVLGSVAACRLLL